MKTIDEVIESITKQSGLEIRNVNKPDKDRFWVDRETYMDALHYLKAYKDDRDDLTALRAYWAEQHENNALTWEELKQMEGKPVWVEIGDGSRGWVIIRKITDTGIVSGSDGFIGIATAYGMDTTWQAYRKERADV